MLYHIFNSIILKHPFWGMYFQEVLEIEETKMSLAVSHCVCKVGLLSPS